MLVPQVADRAALALQRLDVSLVVLQAALAHRVELRVGTEVDLQQSFAPLPLELRELCAGQMASKLSWSEMRWHGQLESVLSDKMAVLRVAPTVGIVTNCLHCIGKVRFLALSFDIDTVTPKLLSLPATDPIAMMRRTSRAQHDLDPLRARPVLQLRQRHEMNNLNHLRKSDLCSDAS